MEDPEREDTPWVTKKATCHGIVDFKNQELELAIRKLLRKPKGAISGEELAPISSLSFSVNSLSFSATGNPRYTKPDLSGLECLSSITQIDISADRFSDLRPIVALRTLNHVGISGGRELNLSALKALPLLQSLRLKNCHIEDVSEIATLGKLKWLSLDENNIVDASPLSNLSKLEGLTLGNNHIDDVEFVKGLRELRELRLNNNGISNIKPLSDALPKLRTLDLSNNPIGDLTPLNTTLGSQSLLIFGVPLDCEKDRPLLRSLSIKWPEMFVDCPEFHNGA